MLREPGEGSGTVGVGMFRVEFDGLREVADGLVPFLAGNPDIPASKVARWVFGLNFDDLVPILERTVKVFAVAAECGSHLVRELILWIGANAVCKVGESIVNADELIHGSPSARSVILPYEPELFPLARSTR